jgi:cytochrome c5
MSKGMKRTSVTFATALVLASASIMAGPAAARAGPPPNPVCEQAVKDDCAVNWQTYGYQQYDHCVWGRTCTICYGGYLCGIFSYAKQPDITLPDTVKRG